VGEGVELPLAVAEGEGVADGTTWSAAGGPAVAPGGGDAGGAVAGVAGVVGMTVGAAVGGTGVGGGSVGAGGTGVAVGAASETWATPSVIGYVPPAPGAVIVSTQLTVNMPAVP
jgi:hypothetical protein